ncbi:TPA: sialoglycan-binding domain-containing protein, partial [Streptococcus agalactiae]
MENKSNSLSRIKRQQREKVLRFSIRKYSFGAASVAIAALMFLGARVVSADSISESSSQSTADVVQLNDKGDSPVDIKEPAGNSSNTVYKSQLRTKDSSKVQESTTGTETEKSVRQSSPGERANEEDQTVSAKKDSLKVSVDPETDEKEVKKNEEYSKTSLKHEELMEPRSKVSKGEIVPEKTVSSETQRPAWMSERSVGEVGNNSITPLMTDPGDGYENNSVAKTAFGGFGYSVGPAAGKTYDAVVQNTATNTGRNPFYWHEGIRVKAEYLPESQEIQWKVLFKGANQQELAYYMTNPLHVLGISKGQQLEDDPQRFMKRKIDGRVMTTDQDIRKSADGQVLGDNCRFPGADWDNVKRFGITGTNGGSGMVSPLDYPIEKLYYYSNTLIRTDGLGGSGSDHSAEYIFKTKVNFDDIYKYGYGDTNPNSDYVKKLVLQYPSTYKQLGESNATTRHDYDINNKVWLSALLSSREGGGTVGKYIENGSGSAVQFYSMSKVTVLEFNPPQISLINKDKNEIGNGELIFYRGEKVPEKIKIVDNYSDKMKNQKFQIQEFNIKSASTDGVSSGNSNNFINNFRDEKTGRGLNMVYDKELNSTGRRNATKDDPVTVSFSGKVDTKQSLGATYWEMIATNADGVSTLKNTSHTGKTYGYLKVVTKEQKEKYNLTGKTITVDAGKQVTDNDDWAKEAISSSIPFSEGAVKSYTWVTKPNTNQIANNQAAKVRVTFSDDSFKDVDVKVNVVDRTPPTFDFGKRQKIADGKNPNYATSPVLDAYQDETVDFTVKVVDDYSGISKIYVGGPNSSSEQDIGATLISGWEVDPTNPKAAIFHIRTADGKVMHQNPNVLINESSQKADTPERLDELTGGNRWTRTLWAQDKQGNLTQMVNGYEGRFVIRVLQRTLKYDVAYASNQVANTGSTLTIQAPTFTDISGETPVSAQTPDRTSYELVNPVEGASIDSSTGVITFTPNAVKKDALGQQTLRVKVKYSDNSEDLVEVPITVKDKTQATVTVADGTIDPATKKPVVTVYANESYSFDVKAVDNSESINDLEDADRLNKDKLDWLKSNSLEYQTAGNKQTNRGKKGSETNPYTIHYEGIVPKTSGQYTSRVRVWDSSDNNHEVEFIVKVLPQKDKYQDLTSNAGAEQRIQVNKPFSYKPEDFVKAENVQKLKNLNNGQSVSFRFKNNSVPRTNFEGVNPQDSVVSQTVNPIIEAVFSDGSVAEIQGTLVIEDRENATSKLVVSDTDKRVTAETSATSMPEIQFEIGSAINFKIETTDDSKVLDVDLPEALPNWLKSDDRTYQTANNKANRGSKGQPGGEAYITTFTGTTPKTPGEYTIKIRSWDGANKSHITQFKIVVKDTTAPNINVELPLKDNINNSNDGFGLKEKTKIVYRGESFEYYVTATDNSDNLKEFTVWRDASHQSTTPTWLNKEMIEKDGDKFRFKLSGEVPNDSIADKQDDFGGKARYSHTVVATDLSGNSSPRSEGRYVLRIWERTAKYDVAYEGTSAGQPTIFEVQPGKEIQIEKTLSYTDISKEGDKKIVPKPDRTNVSVNSVPDGLKVEIGEYGKMKITATESLANTTQDLTLTVTYSDGSIDTVPVKIKVVALPPIIDRGVNPNIKTPQGYHRVTFKTGKGVKQQNGNDIIKVVDVKEGLRLEAKDYPSVEKLSDSYREPIWDLVAGSEVIKNDLTITATAVEYDAVTYNVSYEKKVVKAGEKATLLPEISLLKAGTSVISEEDKRKLRYNFKDDAHGATIDSQTGQISYNTVASDADTVKNYTVEVTFSDNSKKEVKAILEIIGFREEEDLVEKAEQAYADLDKAIKDAGDLVTPDELAGLQAKLAEAQKEKQA